MARRSKIKKERAALLTAWALSWLLLLSLYLWLGCRQVVGGSQESIKHLMFLWHFTHCFDLGNWSAAFNTIPYPPFIYVVTYALAKLNHCLSESVALFSLGVYLPIQLVGTYYLARLVCPRQESLSLSFLASACTLVCIIRHGYVIDYVCAAWIPWILYCLYRSEHFTQIKYSFRLGICVGLGILFKFTTPIYIFGACALELLYCLFTPSLQNKRLLSLRNLIFSLIIAGIICASWYGPYGYPVLKHITSSLDVPLTPIIPQPPLQRITNYMQIFNCIIYGSFIYIPVGIGLLGCCLHLRSLQNKRNYVLTSLLCGFLVSMAILWEETSDDVRYAFPLITYAAIFCCYWYKKTRWLRWPCLILTVAISLNLCWAWFTNDASRPYSVIGEAPFIRGITDNVHLRNFRDPLGILTARHYTAGEKVAEEVASYIEKGYTPVLIPVTDVPGQKWQTLKCFYHLIADLALTNTACEQVLVYQADMSDQYWLQSVDRDMPTPEKVKILKTAPILEWRSSTSYLFCKEMFFPYWINNHKYNAEYLHPHNSEYIPPPPYLYLYLQCRGDQDNDSHFAMPNMYRNKNGEAVHCLYTSFLRSTYTLHIDTCTLSTEYRQSPPLTKHLN